MDVQTCGSDVEIMPVKLIHALLASKVKTITYSRESEYNRLAMSLWSIEFLPVPKTTFECDALLGENLDKFIADAKERLYSSF